MKVIEITTSAQEHKSMCVSDFLVKWFAGQIPGLNLPYMSKQKNFKTPQRFAPATNIEKSHIVTSIKQGLVFVDQKRVPHLPFTLKGKTKILVGFENETLGFPANSFAISKKSILYEDSEIIAIHKPEGLPSQSTFHVFEDHAKALLYEYYLKNLKGIKAPYLALSHRLDRDTSGVLLLTKKTSINKGISDLFSKRQIVKSYLALVKTPQSSSIKDSFTVKGLITKTPTPKHPFYFSMHPTQGQDSETRFKVLKQNPQYTLLECHPITGRSHQIRVHLKHLGLPILGDPFYGEGAKEFPRLALHSYSLKFTHPHTQALTEIVAPEPKAFQKLFT